MRRASFFVAIAGTLLMVAGCSSGPADEVPSTPLPTGKQAMVPPPSGGATEPASASTARRTNLGGLTGAGGIGKH